MKQGSAARPTLRMAEQKNFISSLVSPNASFNSSGTSGPNSLIAKKKEGSAIVSGSGSTLFLFH